MKILLTSNLNSGNPVIDGFYYRISKFAEIKASIEEFWNMESISSYDVIHIQWPEELFGWKEVNSKDLENLIKCLNFWKNSATKLIITRHNRLPHTLNELYFEIYKEIYSHVDAVIHYSNTSIQDFNNLYRELIYKQIIHKVIYHPMYSDISNQCTFEEARNFLNIDKNKNLILVFGAIRHKKEREFILKVFNRLDLEGKVLIVPRWYQGFPKKELLKWLKSKIMYFINKFANKDLLLEDRFILEEEIQYYFNAANIVFIPRFEVLNSGVLILAYSFNKIVVGPSTGSIGELLNLSNNPSFEVGNIEDATIKIKKGIEFSRKDVNNLKFAEKYMNWDLVIKNHMELYNIVMKN